MPKYLNIACGATYIRSDDWENLDYVSSDRFVRASNIVENLGASQRTYEAIYCSHFFEHIPTKEVHRFLLRCRSLMRDGSILRIVVPDAEFLAREYLKHKDAGNHSHSQFAFVNLLDQCVRQENGGQLARYFDKIASGEMRGLSQYAEYLNGRSDFDRTPHPSSIRARLCSHLLHPPRLRKKIEFLYIKLVCAFLPKAFRLQNVSFCSIGEKHHWMYDFESLRSVLADAGFSHVERHNFDTSGCGDHFFAQLDERDGAPRKGHHQLFVEAKL